MPPPSKLHHGDVVLVPFPFADLAGRKIRPALIVSGDPQSSEVILAFITSVLTNRSPRGAEVELRRADTEFGVTGLKADSLVRLDKLVTVSVKLISRRLGKIGPVTHAAMAEKLRRAFDLKQ
jgi:mRNA interferase MazF